MLLKPTVNRFQLSVLNGSPFLKSKPRFRDFFFLGTTTLAKFSFNTYEIDYATFKFSDNDKSHLDLADFTKRPKSLGFMNEPPNTN